MSIQPFSSHPPPPSNTRSLSDIGPESLDNSIQTPKSQPTTDDQLGLVVFPLNPLFDPIVISRQRPYSPYDQLDTPLELSP